MAKQFEDFDANLAGEEGKSEETKASWFKRIKKGISTKTSEKKETPEGLWVKCPDCNFMKQFEQMRGMMKNMNKLGAFGRMIPGMKK